MRFGWRADLLVEVGTGEEQTRSDASRRFQMAPMEGHAKGGDGHAEIGGGLGGREIERGHVDSVERAPFGGLSSFPNLTAGNCMDPTDFSSTTSFFARVVWALGLQEMKQEVPGTKQDVPGKKEEVPRTK